MRRRLPAALAALAAGLALPACGGDDRPAPRPVAAPPAGFASAQGERWAFAYPRGWSRITRPDGRPTRITGFQDTSLSARLPVQAGVGVNADYRNELADAVRLAKDESRIAYPGYRVLDERRVKLPGARAYRIDAVYESFSEEPVSIRTTDLLVQTDDGVQMNFFVRGPEAEFERAGLAQIVRTFQVR